MILEAPFSDLKKILEEYFKRKLWMFGEIFFNPTIKKIEKKLEFPIDKVNPAHSAKNIQQPSILLHGTKDTKILKYHSNLIFNNLPTNNKIIYEVKNADHNNIKEIWKNDYYNNTLRFIDNSVKQIQFTN
jgi:esterase/lipase